MPASAVELLKQTVAKGTSDIQLSLFLSVCQRHGLDPFAKQVYCILYNNNESRAGRGDKDMVIITGIDGYRKMAARDHKDFGGTSSAKFTWFDPPKKTPAGRDIPESATVTSYRKGGFSAEVTVYWNEYAPADLNDKRADFWRRMPCVMLEKVAEAKALRKGFPGLGDVFIIEEMAQRTETQTEGGRDITDGKGFDVHATPVTPQARFQLGHERSQQVLEQKKANLQESIAEHAAAKLDERRAKEKPKPEAEKPAIDVQPTAAAKEPRIVELDLSDNDNPIIRGEIGEIIEPLKRYCTMEWRGDWWHFLPRDLDTIITFLDHCNEKIGDGRPFKVRRITGSPATPASTGGKEPPPSKRAAGGTSAGTAGASAEPTLIKGILIRCDASTVRDGKVPTRQVKIDSVFYPCYRNTLFPFLDKHVGQKIEAFIDKRKQVVGLKSLGPLTFDTDGATECIDNATREAGQKTLY